MEMLVLLAILQTLSGVTAAVFAGDRGCSPLKWYLLSFLLGPVAVALIEAKP